MGLTITLLDLAHQCIRDGCSVPLATFEEGCRLAAAELGGTLEDEYLDRHFVYLLGAHDRLAAVLLLLPGNWGYTIHRNSTGQTTASVAPPFRTNLESVQSNEEGAALLAAIAVSLGKSRSDSIKA